MGATAGKVVNRKRWWDPVIQWGSERCSLGTSKFDVIQFGDPGLVVRDRDDYSAADA